MMRTRLRFAWVLVWALSSLTLVGAPGQAKTTITMWTLGETYTNMIKSLMPQFEKEFPDVDLQVVFNTSCADRLVVAFAANAAPDIVTCSTRDAPQFIAQKLFLPLDISVFGVRNRTEFARLWFPGALGTMLIYDQVYFIPTEVTTFATYYNRNIFNDSGLDRPPATWQEMGEIAKKLRRVDGSGQWTQHGMAIERHPVWNAFHLVAMMRQNKIDWVTPDGKPNFTHPKAIEAVEVYKSLFQEGAIHLSTGLGIFNQGKAAMYPGALYQYYGFRKLDLNVGAVPYPVLAGGTPNSPSYSWGAYVTNTSKNPNLAWKVAKFFSDRQFSERWFHEQSLLIPWNGPWLHEIYNTNPTMRVLLDAMNTAQVEMSHPNYHKITQELAKAEDQIVRGTQAVASALYQLNERLQGLVKQD